MSMRQRRLGPLIVANPDTDSDSSISDDYHGQGNFSPPANALANIDPPAPIIFGNNSRSQSTNANEDVSANSPRSSPAPSSSPPRTPGHIQPPVNLNHEQSFETLASHDRPYPAHARHFSDRDADIYSVATRPSHHVRGGSIDPRLSPVHVKTPLSPTLSEPITIMATQDRETYKRVSIHNFRDGEVIRENIFVALQIADDDQPAYAICRDGFPDEALTNDQLAEICTRSAQGGPWPQFMIKPKYTRILPPPPATVPPPADRPTTYIQTRSGPHSQQDSSSSASDHRPAPSAPDNSRRPQTRAGLVMINPKPPTHLPPLPPAPPPAPPVPNTRRGVGVTILRPPPPPNYPPPASPNNYHLPHHLPPPRSPRGPPGTSEYPYRSTPPLHIRTAPPNPQDISRSPPQNHPRQLSRRAHGETDEQRELILEQTERHNYRRIDRQRSKEENAQLRNEHLAMWMDHHGGASDSSVTNSPYDTLSPGFDPPYMSSRPSTGTGTVSTPRSQWPTNNDARPFTAHPTIRHATSQMNLRPLPGIPRSGTGTLSPSTSAGSSLTRHPYSSDALTNVPGSAGTGADRGHPVPRDWFVTHKEPSAPRSLSSKGSLMNLNGSGMYNSNSSSLPPKPSSSGSGLRRPIPPALSPGSGFARPDLGHGQLSFDPRHPAHPLPSPPYNKTIPRAPSSSALNTLDYRPRTSERPLSPEERPRTTERVNRDILEPISPTHNHSSFGSAANTMVKRMGSRDYLRSPDGPPILQSPIDPRPPGSSGGSTLKAGDHQWIVNILDGTWPDSQESTLVPTARPLNVSVVQPSPSQTPTSPKGRLPYVGKDDSDSDDGTFWHDDPRKKQLTVNTTLSASTPSVPSNHSHHSPSNGKAPRTPRSDVHRNSSFIKRDSVTWAFRPPPEEMYSRLEEFFPNHDLDKPVIDAPPSGGSSPTQPELPAPPAFPPPPKKSHKKSIRAAAHDRMSKIGTSAQAMLRKRSTKLWGSKVEEVTPSQAKSALSVTPDSPSGVSNQKPIFKWIKGDLIGKGTYGRVYLALNATAGEMIAVKQVELPKTDSDRDDIRQRQVVDALVSESETLKDLDHPNIVQYLGFEHSEDHLSIFLEYVPGGSIGGWLRKHGKLDRDVVKSFTQQVVDGLEYLHGRGILHRDLKADNILLDPSGVCKISDFGISKRSDDIYDNDAAFTSMQGSIFWMAPEVLHNGKRGYNAKIDIWSLGCLVLEMWAGRRPWNQEDMYAVMFKLGSSRQAPPVPDDVVLDEIEDDFRRQCFAIDPAERPTAAELRKHKFLELKPGWTFTSFK